MIYENQRQFSHLNVLSDGLLIYLMIPLAYWLRFNVLPDGVVTVPLRDYLLLGFAITGVQLFTYAAFGLYQPFRKIRLSRELRRLFTASLLDLFLLLSWLFIGHEAYYSRWTLAIFFFFSFGALAMKRLVLRRTLRAIHRDGKNLKRVLIIGGGRTAEKYLSTILADRDLGYQAIGYIADRPAGFPIPFLGTWEAVRETLEHSWVDEVVSAIETEDYKLTPRIIEYCEKAGVRLSIIPFYADYMPAHPQFDDLNGIPLLNIRRIPLDNFAHAFVKRAVDIVGAGGLLLLLSPVFLLCAIGVKLSSPGPVLFKQTRIGLNRKPFTIYKFRSLVVNDKEETEWSRNFDVRRTRFGAFIRKYSLDEIVQFWNVLKGDMSLVGPRPEIPHFVDQFKEDIPLYMVRHQVRPGITGWAQINGLRGDTPIKERVEHDIYYIENWSLLFDLQILMTTVFKGKFINDER